MQEKEVFIGKLFKNKSGAKMGAFLMFRVRFLPFLRLFSLIFALAISGAAQAPDYNQPFRPQVHFSPREHWTNDPNGLVFYKGEYHLFFQYNPFGDVWGHMSWGHAVSADLLHWEELPVAIPEQGDVMTFTGSVVVDRENSSGFCEAHSDCLVAVYTGHKQTGQSVRQAQYLAYSRDKGRTWTRYEKNPVLDLGMADFRDPSVFWDDRAHHWVMAVSLPKEHKVRFYSSPDLKAWSELSDFGPAGDVDGDWECPDLLRIPSSDGKGQIWALKVGLNPGAPQGGSGEQYFLGNFDGKGFTLSKEPGAHGWTDYGKDDYCAISFNGLPKEEKPVLLGWMSNWQYAAKLPTAPWRGQMTLPRRLSFLKDADGIVLKQEPIVAPLRSAEAREFNVSVHEPRKQAAVATAEAPFELHLKFDPGSQQPFGLRLYSDVEHWVEIGFDPKAGEFYVDRTKAGLAVSPEFPGRTTAPLVGNRPYDLELIVDRSSIEAYAQDGTIAITNLFFPPSDKHKVEAWGDATGRGAIWQLRSIWK